MRTKHLCVLIHIRINGDHGLSPPVNYLLTIPRRCGFCGSFLLFMFHVSLLFCPVCSLQPCDHLMGNDVLTLLCVMFPCVFVSFPYGVSGQVWYLIVSIPDLRFLLYFFHVKHICAVTHWLQLL